MTHEELVEVLEHTAQDGMADEPILKAIRAVVKLHEPSTVIYPKIQPILMCMECGDEEGLRYPCPTIQAIEKELR
jgi:hypothetical protein